MTNRRAACLLAGIAAVACAGGDAPPVVDLTPFTWTWSQVSLGDTLIRYGFPSEPPEASDAAPVVLTPVGPGASDKLLAAFRYGCARKDRAADAPCTVFLDYRLLEFEPPLARASLDAHRARLDQVYGAPPAADRIVRDARGREWVHRRLAFGESGGALSHYSRPIDPRRALMVTSATGREPDRFAARDLARDAIDRTVFSSQQE